jgi:hypothetical protein
MEDREKQKYMKAFESYMNWSLNVTWTETDQIKELVSMAKGSPSTDIDRLLKYMKLSVTPRVNEFAVEKKAKSALQKFSTIVNRRDVITSLVNPSDSSIAKAKYDREKAASFSNDKEANTKQVKAQYEADFKQQFEAKRQALLTLIATKREEQKKSEEATIVEERLKKRESINTEGSQIDLNFTGFEYREVADVVKKHLKIYPLLPFVGKQKAQLISTLTTSYTSIKKPKNDDWLKYDQKLSKFPWSDIVKWLGEEDTKVLHSDLLGRKLY